MLKMKNRRHAYLQEKKILQIKEKLFFPLLKQEKEEKETKRQ